MNGLTERQGNLPAALDGYVQQGQMFLFNAAQNLVQFGRVLTEAKPLIPRGEFENWVKTNFRMSERTAQGYMAVWKRYGQREQFQAVQFSNLQKMLALPEGTEERFAEENDLETMTAREVEKAVQKVREASDDAIRKERMARQDAERRANAAEGRIPDGVRAELDEKDAAIARYKDEVRRLTASAETASREKEAALRELGDARQDLREAEEMMQENQREYDRMQTELLNARSTIARGDADREISEQLTVEDFSGAVRAFLGSAAQMPYMGGTFSQITDMTQYRQWDELLNAVEDFAVRARKALNTVESGGDIIG